MRCTTSADPRFAVIAHGAAPRCRLRLVGELDLATAPTLQQMLDHIRGSGRRYLALDLSELTFVAAAGLHVFEQADRRFRDAGGWLVLTHPTDRIRHLLQITGLHTSLTVHPHRDAQPAAPQTGGLTAVIAF